jgi:hypothetical protein
MFVSRLNFFKYNTNFCARYIAAIVGVTVYKYADEDD